MMFRGFEGMYACLDPRCAHDGGGRVEAPNPSGLGKLFERPRLLCDACGARVFEVASCRECGTAYLKAYAPKGKASTLDFLWGEIEGDLDPATGFMMGKLNVSGDMSVALRLQRVI